MAGIPRVAAVGVGYSTTGRKTDLNAKQLTIQAGKAAMNDAGISRSDIDGIAMAWAGGGPMAAGIENIDSGDAALMMGYTPVNWYSDGVASSFVGPVIDAVAAIQAGLCHTCIVFRILKQTLASSDHAAGKETAPAVGDLQFTMPFGQFMPLQAIGAMPMRRHMAVHGTTEEQIGQLAVQQRYHASLNEDAIFRDPLTVEEFLAQPYVSSPMRLLDCDYPVDSGSAVILTREERARDCRQKPVFVNAAAITGTGPQRYELEDMVANSPYHTAGKLWERTDLNPKDIDCAQLYDGFSIITLHWLEALGFCEPGESGPFIEAGHTQLGGKLPVNTDGGMRNVGRRHGANQCIEAVRQLRGECGDRQVPDASAAVWTNSVGFFSGAVLMTGD